MMSFRHATAAYQNIFKNNNTANIHNRRNLMCHINTNESKNHFTIRLYEETKDEIFNYSPQFENLIELADKDYRFSKRTCHDRIVLTAPGSIFICLNKTSHDDDLKTVVMQVKKNFQNLEAIKKLLNPNQMFTDDEKIQKLLEKGELSKDE